MRKGINILLIILSGTLYISGQDVQFTAEAPKAVRVGEQFRLTFTVNARPSSFNAPEIKDFYVLSGPNQSTSSSFQVINGRTSQSITISYTYYLQATAPGKFTIDPATVIVDNKEYTSNLSEVEVIGDQQAAPAQQGQPSQSQQPEQEVPKEELYVQVLTNKKSVYQGEHIIATIKLYTRIGISGFGSSEMPDFAGFWTQDIETPSQINLERENVNGVIYNTGIIRRVILFPQRSGEIVIKPFKLETYVRQRVQNQRSVFDDFFGPSYSNVSVNLESKPVKINVKSLPEGKSSSFSGAVGSITMSSSIDKTDMVTNDAITLKINVKGNGNIKLIDPPNIDFPPDFETFDPKISSNVENTSTGQSGSKTFEYLIIPRHAGNFRIPPVTFSYFDIAAGQYKTLRSTEYNITVKKGDSEESTGVVSGLSKEDLQILGSDILFIKSSKFKLVPAGKIFYGTTGFWLFYTVAIIAFLFIVIFWRRYIKRRQNIDLVRNKKANRVARERMKQAAKHLKQNDRENFYESVLKAIWGYISDKLSIPVADLSKETARQSLSDYLSDNELIDNILSIIDECEMARYSPSSDDSRMEKLYSETAVLISKTEQSLRG
ncbi:MAG: protein BatD [Bacteroidales bacterium]|nr:protein BatD [Bacteroidales bacterium]